MVKLRFGICALFMLLLPAGAASAGKAKTAKRQRPIAAAKLEVELPGAHDPDVKEPPPRRGPPPQVLTRRSQANTAVVGPNVPVNDRTLCPNGRGKQQNETSLEVGYGGAVIVAAFNDARGGQGACPADHAAVGWAYSLDGGASFTDGGTLPRSTSFNNGDPWLGVSPDGQTFYLSGLWNFYQGFGFYRG